MKDPNLTHAIPSELQSMNWLFRLICTFAMKSPYFHLDGYMQRWWLVKERWIKLGKWEYQIPAIRLHRIIRSDSDRHLHDHPRKSISFILYGGYFEVFPALQSQEPEIDECLRVSFLRKPFNFVYRNATTRHCIKLSNSVTYSLFITWGKRREWGFYTPQGWVNHKDYNYIFGKESNENS